MSDGSFIAALVDRYEHDELAQFLLIVEQLELASAMLHGDSVASIRAALILLDHHAEILLRRHCESLFRAGDGKGPFVGRAYKRAELAKVRGNFVIDAAARAEQLAGNSTFGIAVAGPTAQRLGWDSPALAGQTLTLDALVIRAQIGRLALDEHTTIYFDEAGMADTDRLERLSAVVAEKGSKLVVIGDAAQLPSIGAGGMFERLSQIVPSAELSNVRRTLDPAEQKAWADLRAGRSDRAMAHYLRAGRLHMADTRDEAVWTSPASDDTY